MNLIHFIWFGGNLPQEFARNIVVCEKLNPHCRVILWNEENLSLIEEEFLNKELVRAETCAAAKSDLVRLELLYKFGGFYFDTDILCFESLREKNFAGTSFYATRESAFSLNNCFLACEKENKICRTLIEECGNRSSHQLVPARYGPGLLNWVSITNPIEVVKIETPATYFAGKKCFALHSNKLSWRA